MLKKRSPIWFTLLAAVVAVLFAGCNTSEPSPPYFGKVLFGPDNSADSIRLSFIAVGRDVFVDRNTNGVPEKSELLVPGETIQVTPTNAKFAFEVSAEVALDPKLISDSLPQRLDVLAKVASKPPYQLSAKMLMTQQPSDSNWVHFGGPLKFFTEPELVLRKGCVVAEQLKLFLGTTPEGTFSGVQDSQVDASIQDPSDQPIPQQYRVAVVVPEGHAPFPQAIIAFECDDGEKIVETLAMDHNC